MYSPIMGNKHWMFDPRFADVVNQFAYFATGSTRDSEVLLLLGNEHTEDKTNIVNLHLYSN